MRLDKFTLRGQEAIQAGIELAERNQNQQVEPEHILCAMLDQPESIVRPLLGKLGANVQVIKNDCEAAVAIILNDLNIGAELTEQWTHNALRLIQHRAKNMLRLDLLILITLSEFNTGLDRFLPS